MKARRYMHGSLPEEEDLLSVFQQGTIQICRATIHDLDIINHEYMRLQRVNVSRKAMKYTAQEIRA